MVRCRVLGENLHCLPLVNQARQLANIEALQIVSEETGTQACSGRNHADRVGREEDVEMKTSQLLVVSPREFNEFGETICSLPSPGPLGRQVPCIPGEIIDLLPVKEVGAFARGGIAEDFLPHSTLQACKGDIGCDRII
ncbi:hypothetical protein NPIL_45161 [Nephila pilipes]|uniref:Uncharacterized protein n=1 Tax=Nephila pilipes TaxID=299642 RepID=A0A8X6TT88_NEPPI|nr:hypothetical protein NPIL_45161 [Nephila pilipes]